MTGVRQTSSGVVQTSSGVADTAASAGTFLTGFENQDLTVNWSNVSGGFNSFSPTAFEGSWSHDPSGDGFQIIWTDEWSLARGEEIDCRCLMTHASAGNWGIVVANGGDTSSGFNCTVQAGPDNFRIRDRGSSTDLESDFNQSYNTDIWYRLNVKRGDGGTFGLNDNDVQFTLYDDGGSQVNQLTATGNGSTYASNTGLAIYWSQNTGGEGCLTDNWVKNAGL